MATINKYGFVDVRVNAYETEGMAKVGDKLISFVIRTDKPLKTDAAFIKAARKSNPDFKYVMRASDSKRINRYFCVPIDAIAEYECIDADENNGSDIAES